MVVRLPVEASEVSVRPVPAPRSAPGQAKSLRILAVDDNVDVAEGLASVLGLWGHTVRTAHDGLAALEVATAFAPQVVLLDLGLPRVDGLEVARRLRQRPDRGPALMVAISGFGQDSTRRQTDEAGFHHHLVKPVDMASLRALLEDCMRSHVSG
jgi:CheY-like chemotaxis protein